MEQSSGLFIRGLHNLKPEYRGSVATIGSFDGVHRGHKAILQQVKERAGYYGLPSVAIIFEPQPREFFSGEQAPARLMRMREKVEAIFDQGIDRVCCLQFNRSLRSLSAQDFVQRVLVDGLGIRCLVVGDDFRFGSDRSGDYQMLAEAGTQHGFEVLDTKTVLYEGGRISSTRIRQALDDADFELAETLLGRPYQISGRVIYGQQLGSQLGIPTANVHLNRYRAPLSGVYAVEVQVRGEWYQGVANVGVRPTVGDLVKPVLEVHIFGIDRLLYEQKLLVRFRQRIRCEKKFASLDDLVAAIKQDVVDAKAYFCSNGVAT